MAVISPIVSANPLVTLLLAQLFLSRLEELTRSLFIGTGVVVVGVALVVVGRTLKSASNRPKLARLRRLWDNLGLNSIGDRGDRWPER